MKQRLIKTVSMVLLLVLMVFMLSSCAEKGPDIKIGGKHFSEQFIMAEMIGILIEENTDLTVSVQTGLAPKIIADAIISTDDIDMYLEYTGTGLITLGEELSTDPKQVYDTVKKLFDERYNIKWMEPYGFNNTYAMVVTQATADRYNLKTITDLAAIGDQLILGCSHTFVERIDGYPGMKQHYGFEFKDVKGMDPAIMYQAVADGSVDVISGFTTDGRIPAYGLVVLEDDKTFFPPYEATMIVRGVVLDKHPELEALLNSLGGRITDDKMAMLNAAVDLDKREPKDVAREFLINEGLIPQ